MEGERDVSCPSVLVLGGVVAGAALPGEPLIEAACAGSPAVTR